MVEAELTRFQVEVAHVFFRLKASQDYVVAGGAALLALGLINRPTQDLDLFTHPPVESVTAAKESFLVSIAHRGWGARLVHDSPTFCRLVVVDKDDEVLVDLAIDSPPNSPPTMTFLGPTLAPLELAGRKLLALFGRAEARDFADVYVLVERFGKEALLAQAAEVDPGFDRRVLGQMVTTLDRFADEELPLSDDAVLDARAFFVAWADELTA